MRFELIEKSPTDYRIYDNEKQAWCSISNNGGEASYIFETFEEAFENLEILIEYHVPKDA